MSLPTKSAVKQERASAHQRRDLARFRPQSWLVQTKTHRGREADVTHIGEMTDHQLVDHLNARYPDAEPVSAPDSSVPVPREVVLSGPFEPWAPVPAEQRFKELLAEVGVGPDVDLGEFLTRFPQYCERMINILKTA